MSDPAVLPEDVRLLLASPEGDLLRADVVSWAQWRGAAAGTDEERWAYIQALFRQYREFRTLLDHRLSKIPAFAGVKVSPAWPRANDLHIYCERIGGGFRVQHGHSTWVMAQSIGAHFHVNQNVTIGMGRGGKPTIGDHVSVYAGAVVTGNVRIGDNVVIAPNAFVNFDVADDMTVLPAPAVVKPRKPRDGGAPKDEP